MVMNGCAPALLPPAAAYFYPIVCSPPPHPSVTHPGRAEAPFVSASGADWLPSAAVTQVQTPPEGQRVVCLQEMLARDVPASCRGSLRSPIT